MIIGLTGLAACGKSTSSKYMKERHGYSILVFSDVLIEEGKRRGMIKDDMPLEAKKMELSKLGDIWRKETGKDFIIAEKLIEKIKAHDYEDVIVDGFRAPGEVALFKKNFNDFILVYVDASEKSRFDRRRKEDPAAKLDDFRRRDENDIKNKKMDQVFKLADLRIDNNNSKNELYKSIEKIVSNQED